MQIAIAQQATVTVVSVAGSLDALTADTLAAARALQGKYAARQCGAEGARATATLNAALNRPCPMPATNARRATPAMRQALTLMMQ